MQQIQELQQLQKTLPKSVLHVLQVLQDNGHTAYLVGGCIRNTLLGIPVNDYDVATSALPEEITAAFAKTIQVGAAFGTIVVVSCGENIEVTTYRGKELYAKNSRHPTVTYATDIEDDLGRRDFTMNAIAFNPVTAEVIDPYNGILDTQRHIIRCVGNARLRLIEDPLRMIRACRFAATLGFSVDTATNLAIRALSGCGTTNLSDERIGMELMKMLEGINSSYAIKLMDDLGVLPDVLPMISNMTALLPDGDHHHYNVFDHTLLVMRYIEQECNNNIGLKYAALYHDIGKYHSKVLAIADTNRMVQSEYMKGDYHKHEEYSVKYADIDLRRLAVPKQLRTEVLHLIKYHMKMHYLENNNKNSRLRRFIREHNKYLPKMFSLMVADLWGMNCDLDETAQTRITAISDKLFTTETVLQLKVNGNDIIRRLHLNPKSDGKIVGEVIQELWDRVDNDPSFNSHFLLRQYLDNKYERHFKED